MKTTKDAVIVTLILGGLAAAIAVLVGVGFYIDNTPWGKERARLRELRQIMNAHVANFELDVTKLPSGGRLPTSPRLLVIEQTPTSNDAGERVGWSNRHMPSFDGVSNEWFAERPNEVNTVVVIQKDSKRSGTYSNGRGAFTQKWQVMVINLSERTIISKNEFTGGPPDAKVVEGGHPLGREGRRVGSDPEGVGGWIASVVKSNINSK